MRPDQVPLIDLKKLVLSELVEFHSKRPDSVTIGQYKTADDFIMIDYEVSTFKLKSIYQNSTATPLCYFKTKNSHKEYLALGSCRQFQGTQDSTCLMNSLKEEGLFLFGGVRFDQKKDPSEEWEAFGKQYFFIPRLLLTSENDRSLLRFYFKKDQLDNFKIQQTDIFEIDNMLSELHGTGSLLVDGQNPHPSLKYSYQVPDVQHWTQNIKYCLQNFNQNLEKVVLGRKQVFKTDCQNLIPYFLNSQNLAGHHYLFFLRIDPEHLFVSLSPEKLFKVENSFLSSEALAGTKPRGDSKKEDLLFEEELKSSEKELHEHGIVVSELENIFQYACSHNYEKGHLEILKLNSIQHLKTQFRGQMATHISPYQLIDIFHPTPAVGGRPKKEALAVIREREGFDRGLYASPIGVLSKNFSEVIVGIRAALHQKNTLHIYGGAGIVPGSSALAEWSETQNKMQTIRENLQ